MKKLFSLLAMVLTVCSTAMSQYLPLEYLSSESEVGTIGTLNGRKAMVVDLGGTIGKVAIAMENVGAIAADPYGTRFTTNSEGGNNYDPREYTLEGGWYVPSKEELTALKSYITSPSKTDVISYAYFTGYPDLQFPLRTTTGYKSSYGSYLSSTTTGTSQLDTKYAYLYIANKDISGFMFNISIQEGQNLTDLAIRPFHKLVPKNYCLFYTFIPFGEKINPLTDAFNVSIESNYYDYDNNGVITFNGELTSIGNNAFKDTDLSSITFPSSLTSIGEYAFSGTDIEGPLELPASLTSIGQGAFSGCKDLQVFFAVGSQLETIGSNAFNTATGRVDIPASVTSIGDGAFGDKLNRAYMSTENLQNISKNAFSASTMILVPSTLYDAYKEHFSYNTVVYENLEDWKDYMVAQFEAALNTISILSETDKATIQGYIDAINKAGTFDDVCEISDNALAFIELCKAKAEAIAAIKNAMQGNEGSAYLNNLVAEEVATIKNATKIDDITNAKKAALSKLEEYKSKYDIYKEVAAIELGSFITKQNGPVTEVIGADGQTIKLYKMKKVKFINVNDK